MFRDTSQSFGIYGETPIPIERSALLVIDVQDSFKATPRWERRSSPKFEESVDRLVQSYRAAGLPVIFFLHTDSDPGFATDSPYFKLMDFLVRRDDEPLLLKNTRNAFTSTNLQELLREKGVERLVIRSRPGLPRGEPLWSGLPGPRLRPHTPAAHRPGDLALRSRAAPRAGGRGPGGGPRVWKEAFGTPPSAGR